MPGIVPGTFDLVFGIGLIVATAVAMWFRLGVPPHLDRHREALTGRFNGPADVPPRDVDSDPGFGDSAVAYVDRIVDRQVNKVRGILSFDGLMLTFLGLISRSGTRIDITARHPFSVLVLMGMLIAASGMCLFQFRARWGDIADFKTFSGEIASTLNVARRRSFWIERTLRLSLLSLAGIVILVLATVIGD